MGAAPINELFTVVYHGASLLMARRPAITSCSPLTRGQRFRPKWFARSQAALLVWPSMYGLHASAIAWRIIRRQELELLSHD